MTELPTSFGKYFLTEKLATGGMAEIYLAKLVGPGGFEKQLVIKQIHPRLTGQRHFVDLFVAEAKTLVTLAHGNIVPVYELGVLDDTYFIAMEYIDGPTLYRLTETLSRRDARMDPALAAWITARILEGLDYAHRKGEGVIHRDLSPRNVMLSRDGEVKLVDFGIAVTLGADDAGTDLQSAPTGSFPYMSPEQVRREPLTVQTDLFSVGVLFWEMLAGHRLFARPDPDATLAAVVNAAIPRPSHERPEVPARLDEVVMHALERDCTSRWSSAGEMLAALQRYLYALDATPGPRDLAALVARYCPPETRRVPTHADPPLHTDDDAPPPGGPRTAVIPRSSPSPGGKRRARTETFATNVDLKHMLERATPLFPIAAIRDEPAPPPDAPSETPPTDSPARSAARMASIRPDAVALESEPRSLPVPGRTPPSRGLLLAAALGTLALGAFAIYVFATGRAAVLSPDAPLPDAPPQLATTPDAPLPDAPPTDAPLSDAPLPAPRDAATRPRDAVDIPPRPTGNGTLKIGADPWGEIVIDGTPRGRTPQQLILPAGRHTIDVIFKGEDPPRKKTFQIDLGVGETLPLQADFTAD